MIRKTKKRMGLCVTLLVLNLAFIWGNSLCPGEVSAAFSQWVKGILQFFFPSALPGPSGSGFLRKLAHFSEFCALGILLCCLHAMTGTKRWQMTLLPLGYGFLAACVDETIQRFVPGRCGCFTDVCIDTAGVILGILLLNAGSILYKKWKTKTRRKTQ